MTAARSFDGAGVRLAGQAGRLALAPHRLAGEGAAQEPAAQAIRGHAHIGSAIEGDWSEPARTSLSHPLRIDEVSAGPGNGCIGLCICPGKCGASLMGQRWQRDLALDLDVVQRWRPDAVVTLVEPHELEMLGVAALGEQVQARRIEWHHLPIVDVRPPDQRFERGWGLVGDMLTDLVGGGGRVLVHCRGGLGRAGTVAARMLVELDWGVNEAVAHVRRARPGAIETQEQLQYVLNLRSRVRRRNAAGGHPR